MADEDLLTKAMLVGTAKGLIGDTWDPGFEPDFFNVWCDVTIQPRLIGPAEDPYQFRIQNPAHPMTILLTPIAARFESGVLRAVRNPAPANDTPNLAEKEEQEDTPGVPLLAETPELEFPEGVHLVYDVIPGPVSINGVRYMPLKFTFAAPTADLTVDYSRVDRLNQPPLKPQPLLRMIPDAWDMSDEGVLRFYANGVELPSAGVVNVDDIVGDRLDTAVGGLNDAKTAALADLTAEHTAAVTDIETEHTAAVTEVQSERAAAVTAIENTQDAAVTDVETTRDTSIAAVENSRDDALDTVHDAVTTDIAGRGVLETAATWYPGDAAGGFIGENGRGTDFLFDKNGEILLSILTRWLPRLQALGIPSALDSYWYGAGFVGENGRATELMTDTNGLVPLEVLQAQAARVGSLIGAAARLDVGLTAYGFPRDYMANEWYLRWTRMLLRRLLLGDAGTQFDIAIIGDSYSFATIRWSGPFWQAMKTQFGDAGVGWVAFSSLAGIGLANASPRSDTSMAVAGSWAASYYGTMSPDLGSVASSTVGDTITVTFPAGQTSAKLFFIGGAAGSAISYAWNGNGAGATALSTAGATALQTATLTGIGSTSTTLTITVTGGTVTLCGVDIRNSANGIRVHKIAATGSSASQWAAVNTASWNAGIAAIAPKLVIVMLGANDQGGGRTAAQYSANMQTVLTNLRTALGATAVDLAVVMQAENQRGLTPLMSSYASAMQPIADTSKAAFLDLQYVFGDDPANYAYGSARPWYASDNLHPDPLTGGRVMADAIIRMVTGR